MLNSLDSAATTLLYPPNLRHLSITVQTVVRFVAPSSPHSRSNGIGFPSVWFLIPFFQISWATWSQLSNRCTSNPWPLAYGCCLIREPGASYFKSYFRVRRDPFSVSIFWGKQSMLSSIVIEWRFTRIQQLSSKKMRNGGLHRVQKPQAVVYQSSGGSSKARKWSLWQFRVLNRYLESQFIGCLSKLSGLKRLTDTGERDDERNTDWPKKNQSQVGLGIEIGSIVYSDCISSSGRWTLPEHTEFDALYQGRSALEGSYNIDGFGLYIILHSNSWLLLNMSNRRCTWLMVRAKSNGSWRVGYRLRNDW
jgi:hypothetical protein